MKYTFAPLLIGIVAGAIDILPMIKQKLNKYFIGSAFMYHLIMPFVVFHVDIALPGWLKGGAVYLICSIPILILVTKDDKKSVPIIAATSFVIGLLVGMAYHFLAN